MINDSTVKSEIHTPEDAFQHFLSYSGNHGQSEEVKLMMWQAFQAAYPA